MVHFNMVLQASYKLSAFQGTNFLNMSQAGLMPCHKPYAIWAVVRVVDPSADLAIKKASGILRTGFLGALLHLKKQFIGRRCA